YNEFGVNGGSAARTLRPKFDVFSQHVLSQTGFKLPAVELKYLVAASIALKGLGSLLFIFGSSFGAYLLFLHQAVAIPVLYDFYNYDADKKQFSQLFAKFTLNMQLLGGILFFIGMNSKFIRRQSRKTTIKKKTGLYAASKLKIGDFLNPDLRCFSKIAFLISCLSI
ncbi:hypothetical protein V2J09_014263, partial [Rumex salicifolius]